MYPDHPGFALMMFSHFKDEFLIYQPLAALFENMSWKICVSCIGVFGVLLIIKDRQLRETIRPIWIFQALLLVSYIVFIGGFWHLNRYLYPVYTLMLVLHAATLRYLATKFKLKQRLLGITLFLLLVPFAFSYGVQYHSYWTNPHPPRYLSGAMFAKSYIPEKVKVGTFQSGCLGYWLDNRVINLDGVMNEEAYFHLKNKTLGTYMNDQKIDYFVDEVFLFSLWDNYLGGQISRHYEMIALKKNDDPQGRAKWGIYKRRKSTKVLNKKNFSGLKHRN
jgi:hypothetical protein